MTNNEQTITEFQHYYMNSVQMLATIIDPNMLYAEWGRATGKTEGVMGPRIIRVMNDMPGELSFLVHKTYVALMTNVWPSLQAYFSRPVMVNGKQRAMLEYGIDYMLSANRSCQAISAVPVIPYPMQNIPLSSGTALICSWSAVTSRKALPGAVQCTPL